MKLLTVAYLLAAATASTTFGYAQPAPSRTNICPANQLENSHNTFNLVKPGTIYYADGCFVSSNALVNLYAENAPKLPNNLLSSPGNETASNRITASITNSIFDAGAQVLACLPLITNYASTVPIHVYIQNNVFKKDAVIRFYGSYPANSKMIITGNVLEGVSELSLYPTMVTQVVGILGWQSDDRHFYMRENSHIEISDNTVLIQQSSVNANKKYELRGIGMWNYVFMSQDCSVKMNSNTITVKGVQGIFNGGMDAFAYIAEGANTKYEMVNNTLNIFNGFAIGCPYPRYPASDDEQMRHSTNVLVTRNSGTINRAVSFPTSKSDGDVIYVGNSMNSLNSVTEISHNNFEVFSSDGNIRVAQTELRNNAQVKVLANTMRISGGNPRLIYSWNMSAYDDSKVYSMYNTLRRVDAFDFNPGSFYLYYRGFSLYNQSEAHLSWNTFKAESSAKKAFLLDRLPEMPFNVYDDKCFKMCSNEYYGTVLDTDALMNNTMPDYCIPYIASQQHCPATPPLPFPPLPEIPAVHALFNPLASEDTETTTTTTTRPAGGSTTSAPYANGCAAAGQCTLAVMAAAAAAAIAGLLV